MSTVYQRADTKYWYLDYDDAHGKRIRRSAKTSNKNVAEVRLAAAEERVRRERAASSPDEELDLPSPMTLEEQIADLRDKLGAVRRRLFSCADELDRQRQEITEAFAAVANRNRRRMRALSRMLIAIAQELVERD